MNGLDKSFLAYKEQSSLKRAMNKYQFTEKERSEVEKDIDKFVENEIEDYLRPSKNKEGHWIGENK